jgi:hypothetical protein
MKTVRIRSGCAGALPCGLATTIALLAGLASAAPALPDEVNVPPGYEVVRLTDDEWWDIRPRINNLGHVVWHKWIVDSYGSEIFLYDGVRIRQITDNDVIDSFADINDHGVMVWGRRTKPDLGDDGNEIVVFDGQAERVITDNMHYDGGSKVNNLGHIVWQQRTPGRCPTYRLMFWDGRETRILVDDGYGNQVPEINDFDQIAWTRYDDCVNPWKGMIRYYTGREIINITDGTRQDQNVTLNNVGLVGYDAPPPENGIRTWTHGREGLLVDWAAFGTVNASGAWAISRWHQELEVWQVWLWDNGPERLTDSTLTEGGGQINDCGEVAWERHERSQWDVMLLRVISGDADHDGKVTRDDFAAGFGSGITGPRRGIPFCEGPSADMDRDGDVDLHDFALMQAADVLPEHFIRVAECMAGPEPPRDLCACLAADFDRDGDVDLRDFAGFQAGMAK